MRECVRVCVCVGACVCGTLQTLAKWSKPGIIKLLPSPRLPCRVEDMLIKPFGEPFVGYSIDFSQQIIETGVHILEFRV